MIEFMKNNLPEIERELTKNNIDSEINKYNALLKNIPLIFESNNVLTFLMDLKRKKMGTGPYPEISMFEAANRIMTDLTILYGIRELLNDKVPGIKYDLYTVEFGNENINPHDIMAQNSNNILIGEAFNVSESFFHSKKSSSLKKLKETKEKHTQILLLFNEDSLPKNYNTLKGDNEYHLPVKIF